MIVGEADAVTAELFATDAVLFQEVVDDAVLVAVDPAGDREEQERCQAESDSVHQDLQLVVAIVRRQREAVEGPMG